MEEFFSYMIYIHRDKHSFHVELNKPKGGFNDIKRKNNEWVINTFPHFFDLIVFKRKAEEAYQKNKSIEREKKLKRIFSGTEIHK